MRGARSPLSPERMPRQSSARSRMVMTAERVAEEALSWITPRQPSGRPSAWRSQSTMRVSISVAAGEVCHSMHCAAIVVTSCSARIEAGAALAGK